MSTQMSEYVFKNEEQNKERFYKFMRTSISILVFIVTIYVIIGFIRFLMDASGTNSRSGGGNGTVRETIKIVE